MPKPIGRNGNGSSAPAPGSIDHDKLRAAQLTDQLRGLLRSSGTLRRHEDEVGIMRISRSDDPVSLLAPTRMAVFATRVMAAGKPTRKRPYTPIAWRGVGWQGWNPDPAMESRMARLPGAGSFYWPNAWRAYRAARAMMAADASIQQIKLETISGREIARLYR